MSFSHGRLFFHLEQAAGPAGIGLDHVDQLLFDQLADAVDAGVALAGGNGQIDGLGDASDGFDIFGGDGVFIKQEVIFF